VFCAEKVDANGNPAGAWETFVGTYTNGTTSVSRDYLISSSTGSFIDWSATGENSSPEIFVTHPGGLGDGAMSRTLADRFYPIGQTSGASTGMIDQLCAAPFFLPVPTIINGAARMSCTTAAAQTHGAAIYADVNGLPITKLIDFGTVDLSTTGVKEWSFTAQLLKPGRYWMAQRASNNAAAVIAQFGTNESEVTARNGIDTTAGTFFTSGNSGSSNWAVLRNNTYSSVSSAMPAAMTAGDSWGWSPYLWPLIAVRMKTP
jgi:hypothetical protein